MRRRGLALRCLQVSHRDDLLIVQTLLSLEFSLSSLQPGAPCSYARRLSHLLFFGLDNCDDSPSRDFVAVAVGTPFRPVLKQYEFAPDRGQQSSLARGAHSSSRCQRLLDDSGLGSRDYDRNIEADISRFSFRVAAR